MTDQTEELQIIRERLCEYQQKEIPFNQIPKSDLTWSRIESIAPERKQVFCRAGVLTLEKGNHVRFGETMLVVLPPHGDMGCWCIGCETYHLVEKYRREGWQAVNLESAESDDEDSETKN